MRLDQLDPLSRNYLAAQYRAEGMIVIPDVDLPGTFDPPISDIVFLNTPRLCEVYMSSNVRYVGQAPAWQQIVAQRQTPGATRRILAARGDFFTGVSKLVALLADAGGNYRPPGEEHGTLPPLALVGGPPTSGQEPEENAQSEEFDKALPENPAAVPGFVRVRGRIFRPLLRDMVEEWRRVPKSLAGREHILAALKTNLLRESKPGIVLLGKEGVGKTSLVEMLARDIALNDRLPRALAGKSLYDVPLGSLVENGRFIGEIERQTRRVLDVRGYPIFFADEIHQLARPELRPLCDILKPALASGDIRLIGATTAVEWRRIEDAAFKRRFLEMTVEEPNPAEVHAMVKERIRTIARYHGITVPENLLREAIMLSVRYLPMRQFPDKVIDILDLAAALEVTHAACSTKRATIESSGARSEGCLTGRGSSG